MLLSIPNSFSASTTILSAAVNTNFSTISSWANGNIQSDNLGTFTGPLSWTISGNVLALNIGSASTTGVYVASLTGILASTKSAFDLQSAAAQSTGRALAYLNLSAAGSTIPVVLLNNAGSGSALSITQSGVSSALKVAQTANAFGIEVTNSGTSSGVKVTDSGTGTAALELASTTKGFLTPRMTYVQRNAIASPVEGLEIYNTDSKCKQIYTGAGWNNVGPQTGDIVASSRSAAAPGFFSALDGASYTAATYPELASTLWDAGTSKYKYGGTGTYPTGTFNAPALGGQFLRGVDGSIGNDPDKASRTAMATGGNTGNNVGSVQANATKKNGLVLTDPGHAHRQTYPTGAGSFANYGNSLSTTFSAANAGSTTGAVQTENVVAGVTLSTGDSETRPVNAYVNYFIKF